MRTSTGREPRRKRVLIVNCYFDDARLGAARPAKIPHSMGPAYLAGAVSRSHCDVRLYCEMISGPLHDSHLLAWPDMLVLTGLGLALDRMLHLTAYVRTLNPNVVVVAGGPAVRAFPTYCSRFFDYACSGDVEELGDVVRDCFGEPYCLGDGLPRLDLAYWTKRILHLEASRYCNFRCDFCGLTGEGSRYHAYSLDYLERQLRDAQPHQIVQFIDNNFYGDRAAYQDRLEMLRCLWKAKRFRGWGAIVTNDFFYDEANLHAAHEAGCLALFTGLESFDSVWLDGVNKRQNTHLDPAELLRRSLRAGIVPLYGIMFDLSRRTVADLRQELDWMIGNPAITLPAFISMSVPLPGTPYFRACMEEGLLLPNTRVRELEGSTLTLRPRDDLHTATEFVRITQTLEGYGLRVVRQGLGFARRYRSVLNCLQLGITAGSTALLAAYAAATAPASWLRGQQRFDRGRTFLSTTERLDPLYQPALRVDSRYEPYFQPTMLTGPDGSLNPLLAEQTIPLALA